MSFIVLAADVAAGNSTEPCQPADLRAALSSLFGWWALMLNFTNLLGTIYFNWRDHVIKEERNNANLVWMLQAVVSLASQMSNLKHALATQLILSVYNVAANGTLFFFSSWVLSDDNALYGGCLSFFQCRCCFGCCCYSCSRKVRWGDWMCCVVTRHYRQRKNVAYKLVRDAPPATAAHRRARYVKLKAALLEKQMGARSAKRMEDLGRLKPTLEEQLDWPDFKNYLDDVDKMKGRKDFWSKTAVTTTVFLITTFGWFLGWVLSPGPYTQNVIVDPAETFKLRGGTLEIILSYSLAWVSCLIVIWGRYRQLWGWCCDRRYPEKRIPKEPSTHYVSHAEWAREMSMHGAACIDNVISAASILAASTDSTYGWFQAPNIIAGGLSSLVDAVLLYKKLKKTETGSLLLLRTILDDRLKKEDIANEIKILDHDSHPGEKTEDWDTIPEKVQLMRAAEKQQAAKSATRKGLTQERLRGKNNAGGLLDGHEEIQKKKSDRLKAREDKQGAKKKQKTIEWEDHKRSKEKKTSPPLLPKGDYGIEFSSDDVESDLNKIGRGQNSSQEHLLSEPYQTTNDPLQNKKPPSRKATSTEFPRNASHRRFPHASSPSKVQGPSRSSRKTSSIIPDNESTESSRSEEETSE